MLGEISEVVDGDGRVACCTAGGGRRGGGRSGFERALGLHRRGLHLIGAVIRAMRSGRKSFELSAGLVELPRSIL